MCPPETVRAINGNSTVSCKKMASKCPSKWFIGIKGLLTPKERDFAKIDPTRSPPISPGPHVALYKSILFGDNWACLKQSFVICCKISRWARDANSGTTPPCFLWIYWEFTIWLSIVLSLCMIQTEVSSQEVSTEKASIIKSYINFLCETTED